MFQRVGDDGACAFVGLGFMKPHREFKERDSSRKMCEKQEI